MKNLSYKLLLGLFLSSQYVLSQPIDPPADDDPPPVPINQWLIVLMITAFVYAFYVIRQKHVQSKK